MKKIVEILKLDYSYPDGAKALENINLEVFEGESIGIIGPNGAGKSTFLLHLNGLLKSKGTIKISAIEVNDKNLSQIRAKVGLVFQEADHQLFMPTVFDDVAFGPINMMHSKDQVTSCVKEALSKVDMLKFMHHSSHHLSIGEKKRISLATILSMNPEIIALDEPSANLDPRHRRDLINLLNSSSLTKIIASHDLEMIKETCSRVILLNKGKIISDGDPLSILKNQELLEQHDLEMPYSLSHKNK